MIDDLDKEYFKKLAEKTIRESDGKSPVKQLSTEDLDKWNGVNIQAYATHPPARDQDTLALYLIDADGKLSKRFTVTNAVLMLLKRDTERIMYGTTNPNGQQFKMILQWEKEVRK